MCISEIMLQNCKTVTQPTVKEALARFDNTGIPGRMNGARVLIKPNFVDPQIPRACSSPKAIGEVARWAFKHGAKDVLVGDDCCVSAQEKLKAKGITSYSRGAGDMLGVTEELKQVLRDFNRHSGISYLDMPAQKTVMFEGVPIRDLSGFQVISLTLPKVHGAYAFSGATKNLVGLVPAENRYAIIHPKLQENKEIEVKYIVMADGQLGILQKPLVQSIQAEDTQGKADALESLAKYAEKAGNFLLHIVDGATGMLVHEHFGPEVKLGFATIGTDPRMVDIMCYSKLGIRSVFYLSGKGRAADGRQVGILQMTSDTQADLWVGRE